ncbi:MAG: DNA primase [Candidatus Taylorbacteria bacterium]|nr:DNA primase [Candidatus Taylorbacteria bacterium]
MGSSVEQIKERLSISDVVSSYLKLEKAGSNYRARCPFHNEKTPSFFVSPARSSYYCFGCNAKGDIFSFVEQFEGLDFVGALKVLAQKAGVELVRENPQAKSEKDRLYAVLETATDFYEKRLSLEREAKEYLTKRGVKEETVKNWRLGFAPNDWRTLYDELLKKGFTVGEMLSAGLVKKSEKAGAGFYDFFRGRVMFPIFDSSDRVIGFSGRIMPALDDGKTGKYVNSPETILFNKSRVLYGLNKAKYDIRKRDYSIMVEGQMDLIMSHQAGFTNTVAVSGTALSDDIRVGEAVTNLGLLTRLSNNIILAFDSDEAGFKASGRNAKIALSIGMDVKVAKMQAGDDPADIILRNPEDWKRIIKDSKHVIDFSLETLLDKKLDPRKLGREIQTVVLPYVASLRSSIDQGHFLSKISKSAGIKEDALWEEMKKIGVAGVSVAETPMQSISVRNTSGRKTAIERKIAGIILWQKSKDKPDTDVKKLEDDFVSTVGRERFDELFVETTKGDLIFQAELSYERATNMSHEIAELILNLEEELIDEKLSIAMQKLYGAERNKEVAEKDSLGALIQQLSAKKQDLKTKRQNLAQT